MLSLGILAPKENLHTSWWKLSLSWQHGKLFFLEKIRPGSTLLRTAVPWETMYFCAELCFLWVPQYEYRHLKFSLVLSLTTHSGAVASSTYNAAWKTHPRKITTTGSSQTSLTYVGRHTNTYIFDQRSLPGAKFGHRRFLKQCQRNTLFSFVILLIGLKIELNVPKGS